jgi:hypothetical protein
MLSLQDGRHSAVVLLLKADLIQVSSYIVVVSFIGGGNWSVWGENHLPAESHGQTLLHNVVHLALSRIQTQHQ